MIDVHCHLNFHSFTEDYDVVIKRALEKGVTRIINVGTKLDSSKWAVDLAEEYPELFAIVGVHPHHADKLTEGHPGRIHQPAETDRIPVKPEEDSIAPLQNDTLPDNWLEQLEKIATHEKVIGIGEVGLDYFRYKSNGIVEQQLQKEVFAAQIELSHKLKLPLQIHNRLAGEDVIAMLKERRHLLQPVPGMFHCFAGTKEVLKDALDLGFYIGFDGNVTYQGLAPGETTELKELASFTPLDRIVTETDSPYLTPLPYRGKRNMPEYVILVGQFLSEVKGVPYESLVDQTTKNVYTIFKKLT